MAGLPAYSLGNQGGKDAMLLPELFKVRIKIAMPDFK